MDDDWDRCIQLLPGGVPQGGMKLPKFTAVVARKRGLPKRSAFPFVRPEDLAELEAIVPVDQADDLGGGDVVGKNSCSRY